MPHSKTIQCSSQLARKFYSIKIWQPLRSCACQGIERSSFGSDSRCGKTVAAIFTTSESLTSTWARCTQLQINLMRTTKRRLSPYTGVANSLPDNPNLLSSIRQRRDSHWHSRSLMASSTAIGSCLKDTLKSWFPSHTPAQSNQRCRRQTLRSLSRLRSPP